VICSVSIFQMWLFMALTTDRRCSSFRPAARRSSPIPPSPLWVLPAAVWLFGERLTRWRLLGMVLGLAGLNRAAQSRGASTGRTATLLLGNFLLLIGAGMWAIANPAYAPAIAGIFRRCNWAPVSRWRCLDRAGPAFLAWAIEGAVPGRLVVAIDCNARV